MLKRGTSRLHALQFALFAGASMAWAVHAMVPPAPPSATLADLSLEELSNIEVTSASKRAQPLSHAAAALFVITADDIRRSGATSLPEVLRLAPNLNVAQVSNTGYSVTARGFAGSGANKLLVLMDGRSVYTPLFAGVFWDIQDVLLQDVERIEVISGPGGTLWGVNAVNGVINVITRSAHDTQGTVVALGAGSGEAEAAARYGGRVDEDISYRIHAKRFVRRPTELASGRQVDDAWQMNQAGMRADLRRGLDHIMVQGQVYDGTHGQPAPGSIVISGVPLQLGDIDTKGWSLLGRWVHTLHDGGELQLQAYLDHSERVVPPTFSEELDIGDVQLQYAPRVQGQHAWVLGAQHRISRDRLVNSTYFAFLPARLSQSWSSLFVQDDIALTRMLQLTLGLRLESNDYTGIEWLPNARLALKLPGDHLLWTAVSRAVRAPSRLDRDPFIPWPDAIQWPSAWGPRPTYLLGGGPDIPSEVAKVFEVGYKGRPSAKTSLSVNVYRALYDNLHTQETGRSEGFYVFAGKMRGAITGLEAWASYQPSRTWRLSAGFAGLYQRFSTTAGSNDTRSAAAAAGRDPARTWQIRSSWDLPRTHELDITARHVSALRNPEVPSYLAVDLRWGWRAQPGLALSLSARNLFNPHGEQTAINTRTEIGASVFAQAVMTF